MPSVPPVLTFLTIDRAAQAALTVRRSRFLAFAMPVADAQDARRAVAQVASRHHDARHTCWAWMVGPQRLQFMSTDNGEPSGTAGRPILGQINSRGLTDVAVAVVRYFGGVKLGTPGLIAAYRESAALALDAAAPWVEKAVRRPLALEFPYESLGAVMKALKATPAATVQAQALDCLCRMALTVDAAAMDSLRGRLAQVAGMRMEEQDQEQDQGQQQ